MSTEEETSTLAERAEAAVEESIVRGLLPPGMKLKIAEIAKQFNVGHTPMREALSRLASRGLVVAIGQRGFCVAPIDAEDLFDITITRVVVESAALRRSMRIGEGKWEGEIVSSLHQLKRIVGRNKDLKGSPELDLVHKGFHASLVAACGSSRMLGLASQLYDQALRYRRIMLATAIGADDFISEHEQLAKVVLARSGNAAVEKLSAHLERTYQEIYGKLPQI